MKQANKLIIEDNYSSKDIVYSKRTVNSKDKLSIDVGKDAKALIVIEIEAKGEDRIDMNIHIGNDSTASIAILSTGKTLESNRTATLEEGATLNLYTYDADTEESDAHNLITLKGNGSKATTKSIYYAEKGEHYKISTIAIHDGRDTKSLLLTKGTLHDSESTMKGLIRINEDAANSDGYQKNDSLILGEGHAISEPELEIHNNDVRCTHGSSVTHIDEEKLFYMQTRGFSDDEAKRYIIQGFYEDALKETEEKLKSIILIKIKQKTGVRNE